MANNGSKLHKYDNDLLSLLVGVNVLLSLLNSNYFKDQELLGLQMRSALTSALFRKFGIWKYNPYNYVLYKLLFLFPNFKKTKNISPISAVRMRVSL
jgi:hypothetical protein